MQFLACKQVADRYRVEIRSGGMNSGDWAALAAGAHVLCMTPQTLLNMFAQRVATFDQIGLLVSCAALRCAVLCCAVLRAVLHAVLQCRHGPAAARCTLHARADLGARCACRASPVALGWPLRLAPHCPPACPPPTDPG